MVINPKSLANLNPQARYMGKKRFNTTLKPETIAWLSSGGNASQRIEDLVNAAKNKQLKFYDPAAHPNPKHDPDEREQKLIKEIEELKKANEKIISQLKELLKNYKE